MSCESKIPQPTRTCVEPAREMLIDWRVNSAFTRGFALFRIRLSDFLRSLVICFALVFALSGCVRVDVGDRVPTIGEQLIDLYEAYELGVIDEAEFRKARVKVIQSLES